MSALAASGWLDALGGSMGEIASPSVFLMLLLGVVIGGIVGIVPGLGALVAMAVMLPFTFTMTPYEAFALLLGTYAVTATTGDLTSILIGVPGQPDSAALVLDGYPLTQQGQANRAMGASVASGTIGALIGAAVLLVAIPFLRPLVLTLGTPETFMLALLGVAVVAGVSGKSILKGVISGGIGLILASVGASAQTGLPRFTFDSIYLFDGIPLIPLAVGIFALVEMTDLHRRGGSISLTSVRDTSRAWEGVRDCFRHRAALIRGSFIGVGVGIVPGVGGAVSQWMSYGSAMAVSKTPEKFGRGAIEGVIAPGACNNSKEGGQLIPTLGFGIPGSAAMAVLLGAFLIQGINPGPEMLTTHLDVTFFMVWVLVAANIIGSILCFPFLRHIAKVTFIRGELLLPFILILVLIGAASSSGADADIVVALAAGILSWIMRQYGWPIVPILLGLVLGQTAENSLLISVNIYGWDWLTRPGVIVIGVLIAAAIFLAFRTRRRGAAADAAAGINQNQDADWRSTLIGSLLVTAGLAWVYLEARGFPVGAKEYPELVSGITLLAAVTLVARSVLVGIRAREGGRALAVHEVAGDGVATLPPPRGSDHPVAHGIQQTSVDVQARATQALAGTIEDDAPEPEENNRSMLSAVIWFGLSAVAVMAIGFFWGTVLFTFAYLFRVAKVRILTSVLAAVVFGLVVQAVFMSVFQLTLPDPWFVLWTPLL